ALLEGTPAGEKLQVGAAEAQRLLEELKPRTESYGVYGGPIAQGLGAGLADLRTGITDRGADTRLVVRFAVLGAEPLTPLLLQLAELARARGDNDLAGFCEGWAVRFEAHLEAVREAAVDLGRDPDRVAAPVVDALVNRVAHGVGWTVGAVGEGIDNLAGRRLGR